ncbi:MULTISPECIES: helix-turn-helix domain-containing protein [unclassified Haloarcula]|uniref:helix-turn-helix domain-containing protein n=1 Tax=unclassified Haloarcula TaxID=2624677 RepID=UPI00177FEB81|nr:MULTISPECIES: helix-turn-helix domain-containing protein [unclassified Haloarcula]
MKRLQVTAEIEPALAPPFYTMLADSPQIDETRVLAWNTSAEGVRTVLFAINGAVDSFGSSAPDTAGINSVQVAAPEAAWSYALVEVAPQEAPVFDAINQARSRPGLVVRMPIVYREGTMRFRVVGDPDALQASFAAAPDGLSVRLDEIGQMQGPPDQPGTTLSERQREVLEVAVDRGYYNHPRETTHEEIADAVGCAPSTVSTHLQKAEAEAVMSLVSDFS